MSPTPPRSSFSFSVWLLLLGCAGWLGWSHYARMARIDQITALPEWSVDAPAVQAGSPTGYAHGWRRLILPESDYAGGQQIIRAQRVLAEGTWVNRALAYENAPHGRASRHPSPGSWWLAALARVDQTISGTPAGIAVERAALYADPLLHVLLLLGAWLAVCRSLGATAAALVVLGLSVMFPFAGNFLAGSIGRPTGLLAANALGLLLLGAGLRSVGGGRKWETNLWFACAGTAGGLGLWLDAPVQTVVLGGLLLGGGLLRATGGQPAGTAGAWRIFGVVGAAVSLLGYLVEFHAVEFSWRLETNHPLYALAWLGAGEVLARWAADTTPQPVWKRATGWLWAAAALAALPVVYMLGESLPPWQLDPQSERLSGILAVSAGNVGQWLRQNGVTLPLVATVWPAAVLVSAATVAWRRDRTVPGGRPAGWIFAGPALGLLAMACWQLSWWNLWQVAALGLVAALWPAGGKSLRGAAAWLLVAVLPGLACLWQAPLKNGKPVLTDSEVTSLIERDLAHWLTVHGPAEGVRVLAPPVLTGSLHYYGGITGLGTFAWENEAGLNAAARIASASSPEEAQQLLEGRGVTHIVMPDWDDFLDQYAGLGRGRTGGQGAAGNTFIAAIHRWEQPAWLRPRAYPTPAIEGKRVGPLIFAAGDPQDAPTAMSRMAEYFVETGRLDLAGQARQSLRQHPGHLGALVATAMVDAARRDSAAFQETLSRLQPLLAAGGDRTLPWDRRISLAVVLATAKQNDAAKAQVQRCLREATEEKLRQLSPQALRLLLTLQERMALDFSSAELAGLAATLLPPAARSPVARP